MALLAHPVLRRSSKTIAFAITALNLTFDVNQAHSSRTSPQTCWTEMPKAIKRTWQRWQQMHKRAIRNDDDIRSSLRWGQTKEILFRISLQEFRCCAIHPFRKTRIFPPTFVGRRFCISQSPCTWWIKNHFGTVL